jgi:ribonuclease R
VTNFGLFVQHPRYLIDGLLRYEDLGDDWWDVDVKAGRVVGERTNRRLAMGSRVKVQIAEVDVPARQLNLSFAADGDRRGRPRVVGGKKRSRTGGVKKAGGKARPTKTSRGRSPRRRR